MTTTTNTVHTTGKELCNGMMVSTERGSVRLFECLECGHKETFATMHLKETIEDYKRPMSGQDWQKKFAAVEERLQEAKGTLRVLPLSGALPSRFVDEVLSRARMIEEAQAGLAEIRAELAAMVASVKASLGQAKPCGGDTDPISLGDIEETLKIAAVSLPISESGIDQTALVLPAVEVAR